MTKLEMQNAAEAAAKEVVNYDNPTNSPWPMEQLSRAVKILARHFATLCERVVVDDGQPVALSSDDRLTVWLTTTEDANHVRHWHAREFAVGLVSTPVPLVRVGDHWQVDTITPSEVSQATRSVCASKDAEIARFMDDIVALDNRLAAAEKVVDAAKAVVEWRSGDISTEDGAFAVTSVDAMIRLEDALANYAKSKDAT